jgi:sucrose-6-phosphate hydrolase SacC (GH32 family)
VHLCGRLLSLLDVLDCRAAVQGRQLLYGWIQEHRRVPTPPALCDEYSYAGCISTPRVLQLVGEQLWQTPLPELTALRTR